MSQNKKLFKSFFYLLILILLSLVLYFEDFNKNSIEEAKVKFSELPGWSSTNILASLQSFEQSCKYVMNEQFLEENKLLEVKIKKDANIKYCESLPTVNTNSKLKKLIEDNFYARYLPSKKTLFTGYIELEIKGRLEKSITEAPNAVPIFKKPPNILSVNLEKFGEEYKAKKITGMIINNDFIPVPSRKIIENEHLFKDHILAYIDDPAHAYFLHIQGSGVITLKSGEKLSVGYAGDNGKNYYSIGKELIEDGIIKKEDMSMQAILAWMRNNKLAALELMQKNKRFIFFKERNNLEPPKGSSGTSVTAMHSAAVDNNFIPYHLPLWIQVDDFYNNRPDKRLTNIFISQDTGSAIKGLTRMDLFLGKGINAEEIAGRLSSNGEIWTLVPK